MQTGEERFHKFFICLVVLYTISNFIKARHVNEIVSTQLNKIVS